MLPAGLMCSGSTVFSGEVSSWWGSVMWHVMEVAVCAGTSVMQGAMAWRSMKCSRMASAGITMTVTSMSGVVWVGSGSAESVLDADLSHLLEVLSLHHAGMPEGGILSGQSTATWP